MLTYLLYQTLLRQPTTTHSSKTGGVTSCKGRRLQKRSNLSLSCLPQSNTYTKQGCGLTASFYPLQGRKKLKECEDGQTAGPLFGTLYGMHALRLLWALGLQILYNGQQFAGPLLLKQITTFLQNSRYNLGVSTWATHFCDSNVSHLGKDVCVVLKVSTGSQECCELLT